MDIKRLLRKEQPAPLWKRVLAYVIDALILALILAPLASFDTSYTSFSDLFNSFKTTTYTFQFFFSVCLILILSLAYWTVLEYRFQQTLGKYFFHLKIVSEQKHLRFSQCLLRNISKLSSLLLLADVLYMFFSHTSQRYSETLAHTEVISYV
ncbi:RDD family protein [Candidatus Woesearchaeota archaeon]|nr:RDD family protein [Candidatus Woesearchaeota archaeon]